MSSADTGKATGPPSLPIGASAVEEGRYRRKRVVVDVGTISASRSRRIDDETLNAPTSRRTNLASSSSRIEEGTGKGRACIRAAAGDRRAPTAVDEARQSYDTNDDPVDPVRWTNGTNDVSSAVTDDATGPPTLPMGTSTTEEDRGRWE